MKISFLSFILSILLGGVITGNILGDMKNKTADIVFFMWKGIQVFRKRVIPANPKSTAQTAQRSMFAEVMKVGEKLLLPILKVYWKRFAIKKSEINAFMQRNLKGQVTTLDVSKTVLIDGQMDVGVASSSSVRASGIELDVLGTDFIPDPTGMKACAAFVNFSKGEIGIPAKQTLSLVNPLTFSNPANDGNWLNGDKIAVYFWVEKTVIVDAKDFSDSQTFILT
jgi:hypothetical protein